MPVQVVIILQWNMYIYLFDFILKRRIMVVLVTLYNVSAVPQSPILAVRSDDIRHVLAAMSLNNKQQNALIRCVIVMECVATCE